MEQQYRANEFILSQDEAEYISNLLEDKYSLEAILLVHIGIVLAPRLIKQKILPGPEADILDPNFRYKTIHVATAMRFYGLNKFGLMYFYLIEKWKINHGDALNDIIFAMHESFKDSGDQSLSLWASSLVEPIRIGEKAFLKEPILKNDEDILDEINFCDKMMQKVFIEDYENIEKQETIKDVLGKMFGNLSKASDWKTHTLPPYPGSIDEFPPHIDTSEFYGDDTEND